MFKKLILMGAISFGLVGCSNEKVTDEKVISEVHEIYEIKDGFVNGELVDGTGEGIYYSESSLKERGIAEPKVGDKIKFTWLEKDYENENWEEFKVERVD